MSLAAAATVLSSALVAPAEAAYSTSTPTVWAPNRVVYAMARFGDRIYIGGDFTSLRNSTTGQRVTRNRVAALDARTGELITSWSPSVDGTVQALAVDDAGTVYIGGAFTSVAGRSASGVAAVHADGSPVTGWSGSTNGTVYDIYTTSTSVYVSGTFRRVNGVFRPRLARLDRQSGALVRAFDAQVGGGRVRTMWPAPDDSSLLVGGTFTSLGGQARGFVGQVRLDNGAASSWAPQARCDTCYVLDLTADTTRAYAAVAGPGGRAVAWPLSTGALAWTRGADGDVQAIAVADGMVYAGGHFGPTFSAHTRHQLVQLDARTGNLQDFSLPFVGRDHPGVWAIVADTTGLHLGGGFTLGGTSAARYARFPLI